MGKVGFIGGGAMAEAIVAAITQGTVDREDIYVSDHKAKRCEELAEHYGIHTSVGADGFAGAVDVLVLAIKPQAAAKAMEEVKGRVRKDAIILSIVAGLTLSVLEKAFPEQPSCASSRIRRWPSVPACRPLPAAHMRTVRRQLSCRSSSRQPAGPSKYPKRPWMLSRGFRAAALPMRS